MTLVALGASPAIADQLDQENCPKAIAGNSEDLDHTVGFDVPLGLIGNDGIVLPNQFGDAGYFRLENAASRTYWILGVASVPCLDIKFPAPHAPIDPVSWVPTIQAVAAGQMTWDEAVAEIIADLPG